MLAAATNGGPLLAAVLADRLGYYRVGLTLLALLARLGSVFWILATPPRPPRPVVA